jgi:hypothetical protein
MAKIHPRPLKQKPYPKAMTIALGIMASDALVIAADSELSQGEYMSVEQNKVWSMVRDRERKEDAGVIVLTGAGEAAYLESAFQEIQGIFATQKSLTLDDFEGEVRRFTEAFYKDHVIPFTGPDRPDIWLVIGAGLGNDLPCPQSPVLQITGIPNHATVRFVKDS